MSAIKRILTLLEAGLVGLFLVQSLRLIIGLAYSRIASASIFPAIDPASLPVGALGPVSPVLVQSELILLGAMLVLPLLAVAFGQWRGTLFLATLAVAASRLIVSLPGSQISTLSAAALTMGACLLYVAVLVRQRWSMVPYAFVLGITADLVIRSAGQTLDLSTTAGWSGVQIALSAVLAALAILHAVQPPRLAADQTRGLLTFWGAIGLGALLYLELALLAAPNAISARTGFEYTPLVPVLIAATAAPLIPAVRSAARGFLTLFDPAAQGWVWLLLLALLLVVGTRVPGLPGAAALVGAQLLASLTWWSVLRPRAEKERSLGGLWLVLGIAVFIILIVFDLFTYEYAYVRDFAGSFAFLNRIVTPLLRGFRGLGLAVLVLSIVLSSLPLIATRRRALWTGGTALQNLFGVLIVAATAAGGFILARPPVVQPLRDPTELRVATYNIHSGYDEFFNYDLEAVARTIQQSGADVILIQEIETARLTSFGVDQALWLARRLGMDRRYFPTNEGLQGLAVLSRFEITLADGMLLSGAGQQTGVQRVKIRPDGGEITLYNTWLGVLLEGVGGVSIAAQEQDQVRQLNEILGLMVAQGGGSLGGLGRLVLGGTFNNIPSSDLILRVRQTGLLDPFADQPVVLTDTFRQIGRSARLDYLFTNLLALGAVVVDTTASDHRLAVIGVALSR